MAVWVAVALMAYSASEQHEASQDQRAANRQERRAAAARNLRERKQAYRQMVVQQAQIAAMGQNMGVSGSSGVSGGIASAGSQTYSNIGFQSQLEQLNQKRLKYMDSASLHMQRADTAGSVAKMFSFYANNSGS